MSLSLMCFIHYSQTEVCHTDAWSPNDLYNKQFQKTEKTVEATCVLGSPNS